MAFVGDSITRQFYIDLVSELVSYDTNLFMEENTTNIMVETRAKFPYHRRYYAAYNATIVWCEDSRFDLIEEDKQHISS